MSEQKSDPVIVNGYELREYELYNYYGEHGRSYAYADCPFCGCKKIKCFIWSLNGGGKKCYNCKAVLGSRHARLKVKDE